MDQNCALGEARDRLERCEQERRESDRLLRELRAAGVPGKSQSIQQRSSHEGDLQAHLSGYETNNARLQQMCVDLKTNLGEEIAAAEEAKQ